MKTVSFEQLQAEGRPLPGPIVRPPRKYRPTEVIGAAWDTYSSWNNIWEASTREITALSPEEAEAFMRGHYDPFEDAEQRYSEQVNRVDPDDLAQIKSARQLDEFMQHVQQEAIQLQKLYAEPGIGISASILFSLINPEELAFGAFPPAKAASIAHKMMSWGARTGGAVAANETIRHQTQYLATEEESMRNIALGAGLGAVFGGAIGALQRRSQALTLSEMAQQQVRSTEGNVPKAESVGAAYATDYITLRQLDEINNNPNLNPNQKEIAIAETMAQHATVEKAGAIKAASAGTYKFTPVSRMLIDGDAGAKLMADAAYIHDFVTGGVKRGTRQAPNEAIAQLRIETRSRTIMAARAAGFKAWRKSLAQRGLGHTRTTQDDFDAAAMAAISRGGDDVDPAIADFAKTYLREKAPLQARLAREGILQKVVDDEGIPTLDAKGRPIAVSPLGDPAHIIRAWNMPYIATLALSEFVQKVLPGLMKRSVEDMQARLADQTAKLDAKAQRLKDPKKIAALTREKADLAAKVKTEVEAEHTRHLSAMWREARTLRPPSPGISYFNFGSAPDGSGLVKQRTLNIATEDILAADRELLMPNPILGDLHGMNRLDRALTVLEDARFGDLEGSKFKAISQREYEARLAEATTQEEKIKLRRRHEKSQKDMDDTMLRLQGKLTRPRSQGASEVASAIKSYNILSLLGRSMISATAEVPYAIYRAGARDYLSYIGKVVMNDPNVKALRQWQAEHVAIGYESAQAVRLAHSDEILQASSRVANMANWAADRFLDSKWLAGLGAFTRFLRSHTGAVISFKLARLLQKPNPTPKDIQALSRLGISQDMLSGIREQIARHGVPLGPRTTDLNLPAWDNQALGDFVASAINAEANNLVLRPGMGERPFVADSVMGSILLQFKTFMLAANNRYYMNNVQRLAMGDPAGAMNILMLQVGGMMSGQLRQLSYTKDQQREFSEEALLKDAMAYGGGFAMLSELHDFVQQVTQGRVSIWAVLGWDDPRASKYRGNRTVFSSFLSPSAGIAEDAMKITGGISRLVAAGEMTSGEVNAIRRRIVGNNLYWAAPVVNKATDAAKEAVGAN